MYLMCLEMTALRTLTETHLRRIRLEAKIVADIAIRIKIIKLAKMVISSANLAYSS